jgi:trehalose 6-phosphate synthase
MSRAIATALSMPLTERRMRWEAMMRKLRAGTIQQWFADFIEALEDTRACNTTSANENDVLAVGPPDPWPRQAAGSGSARFH